MGWKPCRFVSVKFTATYSTNPFHMLQTFSAQNTKHAADFQIADYTLGFTLFNVAWGKSAVHPQQNVHGFVVRSAAENV